MRKPVKKAAEFYIDASALTIIAAGMAGAMGLWAVAGLIILASPFPCPPGLPC